jgi:hypothetical protein
LVKNILAAAGGVVLGALGTALLSIVLFKLLHVKKVPRRPVMVLSLVGGVAVGWAVWLWVSGSSGHGPGPGGAVAVGPGTNKGSSGTSRKDTTPDSKREAGDTLRVAIIRSQDYDPESKKFYLVEGKPPARNLDETMQIVKDKQKLNPALKFIEVVIYQDSSAETLGYVADLQEPVRALHLEVKTHKPGTNAP